MAAEHIYAQLVSERLIAPRASSRLSRPVTSPTTRICLLGRPADCMVGDARRAVGVPDQHDQQRRLPARGDLTRYYEARIGCVQTALGASTRSFASSTRSTRARLGAICTASSRDGLAATSTNWVESTSSGDSMCQIDLTTSVPTNGVKYSSWAPIYPEVIQFQYQDTMLRVVGIGGDGVANPAFRSVWIELRYRRLNYKFWRNEPYWYINKKNLLVNQGTLSWLLGGDAPSHRIYGRYNFVGMVVGAKVSAATQRVPSYEISPSTTEPDDYAAAASSPRRSLSGAMTSGASAGSRPRPSPTPL
jgi:hypothetical protein